MPMGHSIRNVLSSAALAPLILASTRLAPAVLVLALAWLPAGPSLAQSAGSSAHGNTGAYIGVSGVLANIGDIKAEYRQEGDAAWDLSRSKGVSLATGWDFGAYRAELKLTALDAGVKSVNGSAVIDDKANVGVATVGVSWDVHRHTLADWLHAVPYAGIGLGAAGGYLQGTKPAAEGNGESRNGIGFAGRGSLGVLFEVHQNLGFTVGYEYVAAHLNGYTPIHMAEVGLRVTF